MFSSKKKHARYTATEPAYARNRRARFVMYGLTLIRWIKWPSLTSRDNVHSIVGAQRSTNARSEAAGLPRSVVRLRQPHRLMLNKKHRNATRLMEGESTYFSHALGQGSMQSSGWRYGLLGVVLFLLVGVGYAVPQWLTRFTIEQVQIISPLHYVAQKQVTAAVNPYLHVGFFRVNLSEIQHSIEKIPWVETASVTRRWPATLQISVTERVAIAVWNGGYLVSKKGELFKPDSIRSLSTTLPRLSGALSQAWFIMRQYQLISSILVKQNLTLTSFALLPSASWVMLLNNGIELRVDQNQTLKKITHFLELYPRLKPISEKIAYVDLRYPHGVAVGWKKLK